jgi:hypothetical protein
MAFETMNLNQKKNIECEEGAASQSNQEALLV